MTFLIQVLGKGTFSCNSGQSLSDAHEAAGADYLKFGCRGGGCGSCKVKVVQGQVQHPRLNSIACSEEEQKHGYTLACQSTPLSNLTLLQE